MPTRVARVVPSEFGESPTLGAPSASRVFVTAAEDTQSITTSGGLARRLTLVDESGAFAKGPFSVTGSKRRRA